METTNNNTSDDKLKELLSASKLKANGNLKYRIMQQIETEKALSRKKNTASGFSVGSIFSVFGAMYAFIAFLAFWLYLTEGEAGLSSSSLLTPILLISFIGGLFWFISNMDYYLLSRRKEKQQHIRK